MSLPLLRVTGITKHFGGETALENVDLEVGAGEVVALLGANGAGKSTLIKIINGVYRADSGVVWWNGEDVTIRSIADAMSLGIATMFQQLNVPEDLTVAEYLTLGREFRRAGVIDRRRTEKSAVAGLEQLGVDIDPRRECRTLSVAERELVEIVRAVSANARLVIMDEPTASLGLAEVERLFAVIRRLVARGVAVLYVSHKLEEVLEICDRSVVLRDGKNAGSLLAADASEDALVELMVGEYTRSEGRASGHVASEDVVVDFDRVCTSGGVANVSLQLHRGEILGLYGLMGAGRTELLRAIYGLDRVTSGRLRIAGVPAPRSPVAARRLGLGFVPEDRIREALVMEETVAGNLTLASPHSTGRAGLFSMRTQLRVARDAIATVGVKTRGPGAAITALSGGNQQKVVFGRWVVAGSRILLLDDPTAGVDVAAKHEIYDLIKRLTADGLSVIVCSSELPELLHLCDRIAVMHRKSVVSIHERSALDPDELVRQSIVGVADDGAIATKSEGELP